MTGRQKDIVFTSRMTRREMILAFAWMPMHFWLLPNWILRIAAGGRLGDGEANLLLYAAGTVYMLAIGLRFLRRDFDPLCDRPLESVGRIFVSYLCMMGCNFCVNGILTIVEILAGSAEPINNPNNAAIIEAAMQDYRLIAASAVFLAPIMEEMLFRGAIFSLLYERSRIAAYGVSMGLFSLYHVWGYAIGDAYYWIFVIQYLPVSYLLCRCYEKTDSIWCSIFFHMLVNAMSLQAIQLLQELL